MVSKITGIARSTIGRGLAELRGETAAAVPAGRVRRAGGGRKPLVATDATLLGDLKDLLGGATRGDPMTPLLWTAKSLRKLAAELKGRGHAMRNIAILLICVAVLGLVALGREFSTRSLVAVDAADLPTTAVVFTGQFDRVELALNLFDQGRFDRIFISGVNGGAGITPQNFADQFRISSNARAALNSGQIILAPDANTTIENALEAACWLDKHPGVREIVLITGRSHMPRASWALESAIAGSVSVRRLSPDGPRASGARSRWNMFEVLKFGVTVPLTFLPRHLWPGARLTSCN